MWLDAVLGVFLLLASAWGAKYGVVRALFGLGGIVAGVLLGGRYHGDLGTLLPIGDPEVAGAIAYALIFVLVWVAVVLFGHLVRRLLHWSALGWIDHLGGGIFGLAMGAVIAGAALTAALKFFPDSAGIISRSRLAGFLTETFPLVLNLLPEELRDPF